MTTPTLNGALALVSQELADVSRRFTAELASDLPCVDRLTKHVERFHGKMLRPTLVLLAGKACGMCDERHRVLATVVEMVHMATLVHDDVLDDAELRRRGATLNHLKGNEAAVLLGDFLISHSYNLCSSLEDQRAAQEIAATTNRLCEGELLQLENRGNLELDEAVYTDIIDRKTAALIATSCRLGAAYGGADDATVAAFARYGRCVGIAFQIQDDVLDLMGDENCVGKSLGLDIAKSKLTLPLIHFLRTAPHEHRVLLRSLLTTPGTDRADKVRNLVMPSGALEFTRERAEQYIAEAIEAIAHVPPSPAKDVLVAMAKFVVAREV